jgi:hypothetical protein
MGLEARKNFSSNLWQIVLRMEQQSRFPLLRLQGRHPFKVRVGKNLSAQAGEVFRQPLWIFDVDNAEHKES